jgi:hypothetical protein
MTLEQLLAVSKSAMAECGVERYGTPKLDGDGSWIVGFREPNRVMALERFPDREMPAGDDLKAEMELANRIRAAIQLST